ncbi:stage III sporulation protein AG [Cerasibacillus terrae]|uniref:Stage III sporulation protein AG n=1 Tax=Cerasibacillus terrae TaxID=2498845 RepID=A0A5C8P482_9BACI|nr:stage III sporulation protein AG [Cerasibacillus terrae]TXL67943.1 stage III sporulation protein AG [Cerasibacillus terrae]
MLFRKLKDFLSSRKGDEQKKPLKGYIIIIGLIGLLLLIVGNIFTPEKENDLEVEQYSHETTQESNQNNHDPSSTTTDYKTLEKSYEKDLQNMLENIQGVTGVEVMVNLDSTNIKIYEKNLIKGKQVTDEQDKNGGSREIEENTEETQIVVVRQGDKETPLQVQTKKPDVRGVFVTAKGVEQPTTKKWVIEAVSRVLDVPTHKVSVMPKN